jgi:hypothetical protein
MTTPASTEQTLRTAILQHLLSALQTTQVHETPFSHFYLEHAFPETIYQHMLAKLPDPPTYRSGDPKKHTREDGAITKGVLPLTQDRLQRLPGGQRELWTAVWEALGSSELQRAVFGMLATDLSRRFRLSRDRVHEIVAYPRSSLVRSLGGYELPPHPDGSSKIVTMQFYLPPDLTQEDLGTAVFVRRLFRFQTLLNPRSRFERVKQFPFRPNSGYGFAVSRRSFHGREAVPMDSGVRNTLIHVYFADPNKLAS